MRARASRPLPVADGTGGEMQIARIRIVGLELLRIGAALAVIALAFAHHVVTASDDDLVAVGSVAGEAGSTSEAVSHERALSPGSPPVPVVRLPSKEADHGLAPEWADSAAGSPL